MKKFGKLFCQYLMGLFNLSKFFPMPFHSLFPGLYRGKMGFPCGIFIRVLLL
jgi:hypothetical protein